MSFADDLISMFDGPFGVSCTAGSVTANGVLNEPTSIALGDQVLYTDYVLHCEASKFGSLGVGDSITVNGTAYTVRGVQLELDGLEAQISLSKT